MKRFASVLSLLVLGVVVSSCAVGVRGPASAVTDVSAQLNGSVLSTVGGSGSWYIEHGATTARENKTPTRSIGFVQNQSEPVSEPVNGLEPGTTYHFAVCAEDSENPGDPFCSPDKTFTTYDPVLTLVEDCSQFASEGFHGAAIGAFSGFPPFTPYSITFAGPGTSVSGPFTTNKDGEGVLGSLGSVDPGEFKVTVTWAGSTLERTLVVDCGSGNS